MLDRLKDPTYRTWIRRGLRRAGIWTAIIAALIVPVPVAAWGAVVMSADITPTHPLNLAWPTIAANAQGWLAGGGYLPWRAWPVILATGPLLAGWAVLTGIVAVWLVIVACAVGGPSTEGEGYGGPAAHGKGEHGTARWRTAQELARTFHIWRPGDQTTGLLLGAGPEPETAYIDTSEEHELLMGASGSGKSRYVIIPTIGMIGSAKKSSLLITDMKGELYAHTAEWLADQKYDVVRVDLREPSRSFRFNPVQPVAAALHSGRRDQASTFAWDTAHLLAGALEGNAEDPYWRLAAEGLIAALMLAIASGKPPGNPRVENEDPWEWPRAAQRHMTSVYATLLAGGAGGGRLDDLFNQFPPDHPARKAFGGTSLTLDRTRASILGTASAALRLFADDEVAYLTGAQDHDLAASGNKLTATFLVIPDERTTRYPLATLYIQQTLQALAALADQHGGKLPVPVTFLLDEFGNLPAIKDFDKSVTVARSRGIRLLLAIQDLAQLKRHYGDASHTIQGNMGLWLYLSTSDPDTAKVISDRLGSYTVQTEQLSVPRVSVWTRSSPAGQPDPVTASRSLNLSTRQLLTPEEVGRWPRGQSLILQAREHPAKLDLPELTKWASVWPKIQVRKPEPEPKAIAAPPTWRPPEADNKTAGESVKAARKTPRYHGPAKKKLDQPPTAATVTATSRPTDFD